MPEQREARLFDFNTGAFRENSPIALIKAADPVFVRSILDQPFAGSWSPGKAEGQYSIWNTPIGSNAVYKDAGIRATPSTNPVYAEGGDDRMRIDPIHVNTDVTAPQKDMQNHSTTNGNARTPNYTFPAGTKVHVRQDMSHNDAWNGIAAFVRAGGKTYCEGQTLKLAQGGNPSWCLTAGKTSDLDLYGAGRIGMHGGSGLSGLGGIITLKEWQEMKQLRHAMNGNLFGRRFLSRGVHSTGGAGFRWPATKADSGFNDSSHHNYYALTDPDKPMMGALCGILPTVNIDATFSNLRVRWIGHCLQDLGIYITDNTAWDVHAISMDKRCVSLFNGESAAFHTQLMQLWSMLHVIVNNSSTNVGGGGTPRIPNIPSLVRP